MISNPHLLTYSLHIVVFPPQPSPQQKSPMACGKGECQTHPHECLVPCASTPSPTVEARSPGICLKCKERTAQVLANQTEAICGPCLHISLLSRFKTAINNHGLITPTDKVLLAFSGGTASRVALEFLLEIRQKAQCDAVNCKDGIMPVFGLGVTFVDEGAVLPISSFERQKAIEGIIEIVLNGGRKPEELLIAPLESIYANEEGQVKGEQGLQVDMNCGKTVKLQSLMLKVEDTTDKQDLLELLRMQVLQKVAVDHGYTKLVLGSCTSRIAAKVIAATAKGQGFSLPADIQYSDARWTVPVVLPLRDCVVKELAFYCHLNHLETVFVRTHATLSTTQQSINSLSSSFVSMLQEENPSRARTIARTAMKLKPFHFNNLLPSESTQYSNRRRNISLLSCQDGEPGSEVFCPICIAPLSEKDILDSQSGTTVPTGHIQTFESSSTDLISASTVALPATELAKMCCTSCRQILGGDKADQLLELLPHSMKKWGHEMYRSHQASWIRSQIDEFLITDDDLDTGSLK